MAQTDLTVSLSEHDRQAWQMKLWELLRLQTERYTSGQSTSVRTDTAQMLLALHLLFDGPAPPDPAGAEFAARTAGRSPAGRSGGGAPPDGPDAASVPPGLPLSVSGGERVIAGYPPGHRWLFP